MTTLTEYLNQQKKMVSAMRHWYETNPHVAQEIWEEGPYPAMEKLIRMNEILLEAVKNSKNGLGIPQPGYPAPIANAADYLSIALEECKKLLEEK